MELAIAPLGLPPALSPEQATRPALVGSEPVSYGELAGRVDGLARGLVATGARPGDRIAIWTDKGPQYVEAILAALSAGCGYVPLDGAQPAERVATILDDCSPVVLVVDRHRLDVLGPPPASVATVVVVDDDVDDLDPGDAVPIGWSRLQRRAGGATVPPPRAAHDLAAVLYTSGSSGRPKGVQISHGNLQSFVGWARQEFDLGPTDVFANHASFNFDLSTFDLFVAFSAGAAVWVIDSAVGRDMAAMVGGIAEHGVTVWYSVPAVLAMLVRSGRLRAEAVPSLRYVLFAGEVFPVDQLRRLAGCLPAHVRLYNLYGPTETNVCTYHEVQAHDLARDEPVPIGRPVSGARVLLLDEADRVIDGDGQVGELVVEGACVTPGYWGAAAGPVAVDHRGHRHRTGDLVSREHGLLVYRGRADRMVKISGYRVELDEVEAGVRRHPGIADAAAVLRSSPDGPQVALFFTTPPGGARIGLVEINQECATRLPRWMLPRTATLLGRLPRNENGKVDYRYLESLARAPR